MGPGARFRVKRTQPVLPPCESGWTDWMDLDTPAPSEDDVTRLIKEKMGGGEYAVCIRGQNSQKPEEDLITKLPIQGDWIPVTDEGRAIKQHAAAHGGVTPSMSVSPTFLGESSGLVKGILETANEDKQQARQLAAEAQKESSAAMLRLVESVQTNGKGGGMEGMAALVAAIGGIVAPMLQAQAAARQAAEDRAAADRRADLEREERRRQESEQRFERLLAESKAQQQPNFAIKAMESQFDVWGGLMKRGAEKAFDMALAATGKTEEEAGPIRKALAALIENAGPGLLQMGAQMLPALTGAAPAGAPPQQALPNGGVTMQPGTAQVPVFLPPRPPAPVAAPAPSGPPVPPAPPPPPTEAAAPAPSQPEIAADVFLRHLGQFAMNKPDPMAAWEFTVQGMALATVWGMCPPEFRKRMAEVDAENGEIVPTAWAAGFHPAVQQIAAAVEQGLKSDAAAMEWTRAFLDVGPWQPEEEEDDA